MCISNSFHSFVSSSVPSSFCSFHYSFHIRIQLRVLRLYLHVLWILSFFIFFSVGTLSSMCFFCTFISNITKSGLSFLSFFYTVRWNKICPFLYIISGVSLPLIPFFSAEDLLLSRVPSQQDLEERGVVFQEGMEWTCRPLTRLLICSSTICVLSFCSSFPEQPTHAPRSGRNAERKYVLVPAPAMTLIHHVQ